jgi:enhancing lycopene biosynthesis protein 2
MAKIGVVLAGCGVYDGAEIHEAVLTLLALDRAGATTVILAPNAELDVVSHTTGKPTGEQRNVLEESARIARGQIKDLAKVDAKELDAVVFPGGFGAAKNLSNFAQKGADCTVHPAVVRIVKEMHAQKKPIGAACIAPATIAAVFRGTPATVNVTIGNDPDTAKNIEACGAKHTDCTVFDIVVDEKNRVVTTPAYMLGQSISEVAAGIDKWVAKIVAMAG